MLSKELYNTSYAVSEILKYRLEHCITQRVMGRILGCTQAQLSLWECGRVRVSKLREKALWNWIEKSIV